MALDVKDLLSKVDLADIPVILHLYQKYSGVIEGLFHQHKEATAPPKPPVHPPLDEDVVPNPTKPGVTFGRAKLGVVWMQLNKDRFPEAYTEDNPYGLLKDKEVAEILDGRNALNFGSAVRFDLTVQDANGREITPDDVRRFGFAWRSRWVVRNVDTNEVSYLEGRGSTYTNDKGKEEAFVIEEGADATGVGQGTRNYTDTLGFGQRMDFYKEGTFEIHVELPGTGFTSPVLKIKVS